MGGGGGVDTIFKATPTLNVENGCWDGSTTYNTRTTVGFYTVKEPNTIFNNLKVVFVVWGFKQKKNYIINNSD